MERVEKDARRTQSRGAAEATTSRAAAMADFRPASVAQRALAAGLENAGGAPAQLAVDPLQRAEEEQQLKADPVQREGLEDEELKV